MKPSALFYSEKEFELADIGPLRKKLTSLKNSGTGKSAVTFITSQSRLKALQKDFPEISVISENKDFVLASIIIY